MPNDKIVVLFTLLVFFEAGLCLELMQNVAVIQGDTAHFFKQTGASLENIVWIEYASSPNGLNVYSDRAYVYTGDKEFGSRYGLNIYGNDTLVIQEFTISNVTLSYAGKYKAQDIYNKDASAQLIVLESDIHCNSNLSGSFYELLCSIGYQGAWAPVLECSSADLTWTSTVDLSTSGATTVKYNATVPGEFDRIEVPCEAYFNMPASASDVGDLEATNVPSFRSSVVNVISPEAEDAEPDNKSTLLMVMLPSLLLLSSVITVSVIIVYFKKKDKHQQKSKKTSKKTLKKTEAMQDVDGNTLPP